MARLSLCLIMLGTLAACGTEPHTPYQKEATKAYQDGYTYSDRGYWSPDYTSFRSSSVPEGRWMYERGRNQRN